MDRQLFNTVVSQIVINNSLELPESVSYLPYSLRVFEALLIKLHSMVNKQPDDFPAYDWEEHDWRTLKSPQIGDYGGIPVLTGYTTLHVTPPDDVNNLDVIVLGYANLQLKSQHLKMLEMNYLVKSIKALYYCKMEQ